jgi:hypothetical protein
MGSALTRMTFHLSPVGRGRIASTDAIRVRGLALSWNLRPLTRRFAPTSPHREEVFEQTIQTRL